tara:strand:+ start:76 stop:525 length:450 start_codon:yes stop_codon:yes gene_type:complete
MTPTEYKELIKKDTIKIGEDVEMTDSVTELFNELVDDGNDADDLQAFIDEHGKSYFLTYIEDYLQAVDEYDEDVVTAFLDIFDIDSIGSLSDAYQGKYTDGAEFAESIVSDCYSMEMPSWVEVDWQATWDNTLSYDYSESDGHIFNNNF